LRAGGAAPIGCSMPYVLMFAAMLVLTLLVACVVSV
jgi:hypothetical protein